MRVQLDYLNDETVLGHRIRCEILADALHARGHEVTDHNPHWLVVDYPTSYTAREHMAPMGTQRLLLGQLPQEPEDWGWHPLHMPNPRTLTGKEYLIIDPTIRTIVNNPLEHPIRFPLLISMGGYDGYLLTERLLAKKLSIVPTVVVGPNFGRTIINPHARIITAPSHLEMLHLLSGHYFVICGWGQTAFEALAFGCCTVAVVQSNEHADEASILRVPYVTRNNLECVWSELENYRLVPANLHLDLSGAKRIIEFMEEQCQY